MVNNTKKKNSFNLTRIMNKIFFSAAATNMETTPVLATEIKNNNNNNDDDADHLKFDACKPTRK